MPQPTNKLAPEVTGVNRLLDFIVQRLPANMFPTNARTLIETAQGNRDPITEKNFSPEELDVMRQLIASQKHETSAGYVPRDEGFIQYPHYHDLAQQMRVNKNAPVSSAGPSLFSMGDPYGNVQTTLGRFKFARDANGNMMVYDTYDFNPPQEGATQEQRTGDYGALGPYGLIRGYAGEKIPPGYGRPVKINLGR